MANNKVQLSDGTVLLDLTGDTVTPETLMAGVTAHDAAGNCIVGTVVGIKLTGIAITTPPTKTAYNAGETFDPAGMVVTATYSNGAKLTNPSYTFSPAGALTTGDTAITVTYTEGGITKTATQAISVSFKPAASTTPIAGVNYVSGLQGLQASDVTSIANLISDCSDVTNETTFVYVDSGDTHRKISVGDQVMLPLNETNYVFDVIGFNHDTLTTPTAYGAATATGKAGITFQMHDMFATEFAMNKDQTNAGGWTSCAMRSTHLPAILSQMPTEVQNGIREVNKLTSAGSQSATINTTADKLFLLSEIEIFGRVSYSKSGEGTQYDYYKAGNSKVKKRNGSANYWWERSPRGSNSTDFCRVNSKGYTSYVYASHPNGVAFGFCF